MDYLPDFQLKQWRKRIKKKYGTFRQRFQQAVIKHPSGEIVTIKEDGTWKVTY